MTLSQLSPGDRFTLIGGTLDYEYSYRLRIDAAISCRILGQPREHELLAPTTAVMLISRIADRRNPSADAGAECDPLKGVA